MTLHSHKHSEFLRIDLSATQTNYRWHHKMKWTSKSILTAWRFLIYLGYWYLQLNVCENREKQWTTSGHRCLNSSWYLHPINLHKCIAGIPSINCPFHLGKHTEKPEKHKQIPFMIIEEASTMVVCLFLRFDNWRTPSRVLWTLCTYLRFIARMVRRKKCFKQCTQ